MNTVSDVMQHPQLQARRRWTEVETPHGSIPALIPPHNIESLPPHMANVPALGEHTQAILAELAGE